MLNLLLERKLDILADYLVSFIMQQKGVLCNSLILWAPSVLIPKHH